MLLSKACERGSRHGQVPGEGWQHPAHGTGTARVPSWHPSRLGNRTSRANSGSEKEIITREGRQGGPCLLQWLFSQLLHIPPCSWIIPMSPCPVLIPSLPMHTVVLSIFLSFCSAILLPTFSLPPILHSHMFCGKHHPLIYFPFLCFNSFVPFQP